MLLELGCVQRVSTLLLVDGIWMRSTPTIADPVMDAMMAMKIACSNLLRSDSCDVL